MSCILPTWFSDSCEFSSICFFSEANTTQVIFSKISSGSSAHSATIKYFCCLKWFSTICESYEEFLFQFLRFCNLWFSSHGRVILKNNITSQMEIPFEWEAHDLPLLFLLLFLRLFVFRDFLRHHLGELLEI